MTVDEHLDFAILELQRAKATWRTQKDFAIDRLGESRMSIAAARMEIDRPAAPLSAAVFRKKVAA